MTKELDSTTNISNLYKEIYSILNTARIKKSGLTTFRIYMDLLQNIA